MKGANERDCDDIYITRSFRWLQVPTGLTDGVPVHTQGKVKWRGDVLAENATSTTTINKGGRVSQYRRIRTHDSPSRNNSYGLCMLFPELLFPGLTVSGGGCQNSISLFVGLKKERSRQRVRQDGGWPSTHTPLIILLIPRNRPGVQES